MLYFQNLGPRLLGTADQLTPEQREALERFLLPIAGHYRPDRFNQEILEDYRQRVSRKGVSYQEFRQFHLPCFRLLLEEAVRRGARKGLPELFAYPDASFPFETQVCSWMESIQGSYQEATIRRYQSVIQRYLLPEFAGEDLALLDGERLRRYREMHRDKGWSERTFLQHTAILYGTLDFSVFQLIGAPRKQNVPPVLFQDMAPLWLEASKGRLSKETAAAYQRILKDYLLPLLGNKRLDRFNTRRIKDYKTAIRARGLDDSTFSIHWTIILGVLQYAKAQGCLEQIPEFDLRYPDQRAEIHRPDTGLLQKALIQDTAVPDSIIIRLAWQMGLTRDEIRTLRWCSVDLQNRTAQVSGRSVPIPEDVAEALDRLEGVKLPNSNVLYSSRGRILTATNISYIAKRFLERHGITDCRLADLRHDYVIRTLQTHPLAEAAELCGYKDVNDIVRLYRPYLDLYPFQRRSTYRYQPPDKA